MANFDGFDLTIPSNTSSAALGDDEFRSVKSYLQNWFEEEHYATDGSAASAGVHKVGTGRCYTQSAAPTAVNIGEMWHDPDDDGFYIAEAAGTGDWTNVTNSIALGSVNTWTALQNFSSNITVADLAVTSAVDNILSAAATIDVPSFGAGTINQQNVTVTGATKGSPVLVGFDVLPGGVLIHANVVSNDNVRITLTNNTSIAQNPASQEYTVTVFNKPA